VVGMRAGQFAPAHVDAAVLVMPTHIAILQQNVLNGIMLE
jgi:hypothetical protein